MRIIINCTEHETRAAVLEEGRLSELIVERSDALRTVGDVYKGIVRSVLPGMQAAFVDIGFEKSAFLHASDVQPDAIDSDDDDEDQPRRRRRYVRVERELKKGQEVLVQVTKEPIGTKGPRVTMEISLPGWFVVLVPRGDLVGVSRRITNWGERRRLKRIAREVVPEGFGLILRTEAEDADEEGIKRDVAALVSTWEKAARRVESSQAPSRIHREEGVASSALRDFLSDEVEEVTVDSKLEYDRLLAYLKAVSPRLRERVKLYRDRTPIFDAYGIEKAIDGLLERKVWIKKGSYIVIDQTEALVTIDVNTGRFVGRGTQEETILRTNLEAAREIARQLRLRDIGGIIVIDFIDMHRAEHRRQVEEEFKHALKRDRARWAVSPISEFGLLEMTRERERPSHMHVFSEVCPTCGGFGRVLSKETIALKIERWFRLAAVHSDKKSFVLVVHPEVASIVADGKDNRLRKLTGASGQQVSVLRDVRVKPEAWRVHESGTLRELTQDVYAAAEEAAGPHK